MQLCEEAPDVARLTDTPLPLPMSIELTRGISILHPMSGAEAIAASQRSLHNAPIFRLLLKVAVNGTHQCDFLNFCGGFGSQLFAFASDEMSAVIGGGGSRHHSSSCLR